MVNSAASSSNEWSGPATFLDGGTRLWGYTAEILLYAFKNR
jgi:hypothetical protein